uniref:Reverse transcriptase domain-containing protein n=1 Tax=Trichobilharzia regenti TaxID=157069 RepID=A0AA85J701_TRIRE|nr:unnamed protein product [Trichobilharzia regenti]
MLYLDIESLFTHVPPTETVCHIYQYTDENQLNIGSLTTHLKKLLLRCTLSMQFVLNDVNHRQKDGIAMGTPLGPLLVDCFMANLENGLLKSLIDNFQLYARYMDDIFIICDDGRYSNQLLQIFNNCHLATKFTLEIENGSEIPFLELTRRGDWILECPSIGNPCGTAK